MPEIETMKLNDLYNNFKIVEQRLKQSGRLSTSSGNMAFLSSSIVNKSDDDDSDEDDCTASVAVQLLVQMLSPLLHKRRLMDLEILLIMPLS